MLRHALLLLAIAATSPAGAPPASSRPAETIRAGAPASKPPSKPAGRPASAPGRDAYAGASRCADCHAQNHARWKQDWHARALAPATPDLTLGNWNGFHYKGSSSEATMRREGARHVVRALDRDGSFRDFDVSWVVGGKRMQDPVTVLPDGRWQVLPVYWHQTGREWVDYTEVKQGPIGPGHPFFWANFRRTANHECLDCHVTGMKVGYDRATRKWSTTFADAGVACESCHGPGARHASSADPADIVHPGKLAPDRALALCAQCHGLREPLFPLFDASRRFRPGERYEARYEVVQVMQVGKLSTDFFVDGRPRSSTYEYPALLQSACYRKGGATCLTCHTAPHQPNAGLELKPTKSLAVSAAVASCAGCHATVLASGEGHTHHRAREAQSCVACHMPKLVSGVLDRFADHTIDVPVPENTVRHGVPSACGECHAAVAPGTLVSAVRRWWPGAVKREKRRLRLADAIDPATDRNSFAPLAAVLGDGSEAPTLRAAAATLLGGRFPREAEGVLTEALADKGPDVRMAAVRALGLATARGAVPAMRSLLADADLAVRAAASITLAGLDDLAGIDALEKLTREPDTAAMWRPHLELGLSLARRGRLADAASALERARSRQFYSMTALIGLADVRSLQGRQAEAAALLEEALTFDPASRDALDRLAAMRSSRR